MTADDVYTSAQAAAYLHVSTTTMKRLRAANQGPAYSRTHDGRPVYTRSSLDAWLATQFIATVIYAPIEQRDRVAVAA